MAKFVIEAAKEILKEPTEEELKIASKVMTWLMNENEELDKNLKVNYPLAFSKGFIDGQIGFKVDK